jgi:hypothetical protein
MSYVLQIWESPIPSSVQEADEINDRLQDLEGPQNPKFIELAKRLTQRYPCITQLTGDEEEGYENGVWSVGPVDGITTNPVYGIGVSSDYLTEVLPFVTQTANALGLILYDTQAGQVNLPSGAVLTMPGQLVASPKATEVDPEWISSNAHCAKVAQEYVTVFMKKHGFKLNRKTKRFHKEHHGFYFDLGVGGGGTYVSVGSQLHLTKGLHVALNSRAVHPKSPVPDLWIPVRLGEMGEIYGTATVPFDYLPRIGDVKKVSDIKRVLDQIMEYLEKAYFPVISKITTLEELDTYIQRPYSLNHIHVSSQYRIGQLVVAHLVKNKNIDVLIDDIRKDFAGNWVDQMDELEKTIELIKLDQQQKS